MISDSMKSESWGGGGKEDRVGREEINVKVKLQEEKEQVLYKKIQVILNLQQYG